MDKIRQILEENSEGVTPGGQLVYGFPGDIQSVSFGTVDGEVRVASNTVYDVASLTKPFVTWLLTLQLCSEEKLSLKTSLEEFNIAPNSKATVGDLLGHRAGYPAHREYWKENLTRPLPLLSLVRGEVPTAEPGTSAVYSDVGYIHLGGIVEDICEQSLDEQFREKVTKPLSLLRTGFFPNYWNQVTIAPTEVVNGSPLVGEVHDENARAGQGPFGHAGLFSTGEELSVIVDHIALLMNGVPTLGIEPALLQMCWDTVSVPGSSWRLGWDTPSPPPVCSTAGDLWPRDSVGHLGYTGCSIWLHRASQAYAILLTNRVFYGRFPEKIRQFRRTIMDAVATELFGP